MWRFINKQGIEIIPCEYFEDTLDDEIVVNWDEIENEELREQILTLIEKDKQS